MKELSGRSEGYEEGIGSEGAAGREGRRTVVISLPPTHPES